ncbi:hypothetical protein C8F01DRAFT_1137287 [Mycena amicta]|nr:hypothetical protein C8F01DRAFT_1137287 [Mycena amicta]
MRNSDLGIVSAESVVQLSKLVLVPLRCEVPVRVKGTPAADSTPHTHLPCGRVLNCWNAFVNHQVAEHHKASKGKSSQYQCRIPKCPTKRLQSVAEWKVHIEDVHLATSISLPCPFTPCPGLLPPHPAQHHPRGDAASCERALLSHLDVNHRTLLGQSLSSIELKPTSLPFSPNLAPPPPLHQNGPLFPSIPPELITLEKQKGSLVAGANNSIPLRHTPKPLRPYQMRKWPGIVGSLPVPDSKLGKLQWRTSVSLSDDADSSSRDGLKAEVADKLELVLDSVSANLYQQLKADARPMEFLGSPYLQLQRAHGGTLVDLVRPPAEPASTKKRQETLEKTIFFDAVERMVNLKAEEKKANKMG